MSVYRHLTLAEQSSEQPSPPVGESRGGVRGQAALPHPLARLHTL